MSEEVKKHCFDKFYQGDSSHAQKGNGLGLAMVKQIINLIDADIKVESVPDVGTTFSVTI
jgi:signal transduction histidine kinase